MTNQYIDLSAANERIAYLQQLLDNQTERTTVDHDRIAQLVTRVTSLESLLEQAKDDHRTDVRKIGDAIIDKANEFGYCETFDKLVDEVNRTLRVELPTRQREYTVQVSYVVDVEVKVTALSEDDAHDRAYSDLSERNVLNLSQSIGDYYVARAEHQGTETL